MHIDLTQLDYFRSVAKCESITLAAKDLHISQPALSKVIAKLEDDLDVKLFDRIGKTIRLNDNGKVVLEYSEDLFSTVASMENALQEMKDGGTGTISIGTSIPVREPNWLLQCMSGFMLRFNEVSFSLTQMSTENLESALLNRTVDIGICSQLSKRPEFEWIPLYTERMGILLSAEHPLAAKEPIRMRDMENERFLCHNMNSDVQALTLSFCRQAGFEAKVCIQSDFRLLMGWELSRNNGISFISEPRYWNSDQDWRKGLEREIIYRPVEDAFCVRSVGVATLRNHFLSKTALELKQAIIDQHSQYSKNEMK